MKDTLKKIIVTSLFLSVVSIANSQDFSYTIQGGQTLYFNLVDGSAMVTRPADTTLSYYHQLGNLIIPSDVEYNGNTYTVTSIDSNAFSGCSGLTRVTIPHSITAIGEKAFLQVSDLTRTDYLGSLAQWCNIDFGSASANPIYTSGNLFVNNSAVNVESFNTEIPVIKPLAFAGLTSLSGNLVLQSPLSVIGSGAFYRCSGLTHVVLPPSLQIIGDNAFRECVNISDINIPEGMDSIGAMAFATCSGLQAINIPHTVRYLGNNTFYQCSSLQTVYYNATNCHAGSAANNLIYPVFGSSCTSLTQIIIGENVKMIPDYTFSFCKRITEVIIPDSVVSIGKASFQTCDLLASVAIGKGVQSVGDSAFGWCNQLWRVNMRSSTPPTYGVRSFQNVSSNLKVYVPCEAVTTYENNAQWGQFDIEGQVAYYLSVVSEDETKGTVIILEPANCDNPQALIKATALPGYTFSHWSDGNTDNPRYVVMNRDVELTAYFEITSSINDATSSSKVNVLSRDLCLVVLTESIADVLVCDIMGRTVATFVAEGETICQLPCSGIYLVKVGREQVRKIVAY